MILTVQKQEVAESNVNREEANDFPGIPALSEKWEQLKKQTSQQSQNNLERRVIINVFKIMPRLLKYV